MCQLGEAYIARGNHGEGDAMYAAACPPLLEARSVDPDSLPEGLRDFLADYGDAGDSDAGTSGEA